jgi:mannose-1-phosphate guanylyltransferase/phosphomannomutase
MPGGYYLGVNTRIAENVTIVPPVIIGNDCDIAAGATLGPNTVIGNGWTVGQGSSVVDTIAWQHYGFTNLPDQRQIGAHLAIEKCILVGGVIEESLKEKVVDLKADGNVVATSIDAVPAVPRA